MPAAMKGFSSRYWRARSMDSSIWCFISCCLSEKFCPEPLTISRNDFSVLAIRADKLSMASWAAATLRSVNGASVLISVSGDFEVEATITNSLLRSEEHTSELQSRGHLVCRLLLEKIKIYYSLSMIH